MTPFSNEIISDIYNELLELHSVEESNYIISNSLAILGDKKIVPSTELSKNNIKRIDNYKYPERLVSFIKITLEKSETWKAYSFTKFIFR